MAIDIKKYIVRFSEEARDHINKLSEGLSELAAGNADKACIDNIFRSVHTIKGSSRMLKLTTITQTAHKLEDVMGALRDGSLKPTPQLAQLLCSATDTLSALVERLAEKPDGDSLPPADQALLKALTLAVSGLDVEALHRSPADPASPPLPAELLCAAKPLSAAATPASSPGQAAPQAQPQAPAGPASALTPSAPPQPPLVGSVAAKSAPQGEAEQRLKPAETVRVRLGKLDELIKLMGEVVSSHASMRQRLKDIRALENELALSVAKPVAARLHRFVQDLRDDVQAQEVLKDELHDKMLVMRMLPLAIIFEPAAHLVREMARSVGKQVECVVKGSEIELDRQMIDKLSDPIIHLIRNAVDHGLETAETRAASGKPAQGRLTLSARQDGSWVVIDVADDGGGIPLEAVRAKAVKKGFVSQERAASLSDEESIDLVFLPGFSTSSIITDLSGRGVGMDVVKQCVIDDLRGTISVETCPLQGATFSLRLPLSLAVMRVVLVEAQGLAFGFTSQYVEELLRLPRESLMRVAEREAVIIRNEFVPVAHLAEMLGIPSRLAGRPPGRAGRTPSVLLLVLRVRNEKIALMVDDLLDERDMVIKTLPEHMRSLPLMAGMVTTGGTELVSVLHAPGLIDLARRTAPRSDRAQHEERGRRSILVVDDSMNTREIEKDVLEANGYAVTLAEDGVDGLRKALDGDFDAVLTDVEMPNMDGFTLTARLRQEERYRNKPIVIITSREKEEDKRRGIQVGADAYIVKGDFAQSNLAETLRVLLG